MFTGLIREFATVIGYQNNILNLKAKYKPKIGDSIAVNGVCLTVITLGSDSFAVELSNETRNIMAVENLKGRVHIEPAMKLSDRLEGHIVQGHVDCQGVIKAINKNQNATDFHITHPKEFSKYIAPKGSIAIDGVSLTVNDVKEGEFRLTIIPHTLALTLFGEYKTGTKVNIETDMFARYIHHMINTKSTLSWKDIDNIMAQY
ncbi:MAG: riboflavin synthase [Sulfurospirillaceae bacterium]|nr:riboflavin synthase [Sulfurospirillaceae bacterium]